MNRIKIKALSVNLCWRGRRFKTDDYLDFEKEMLHLLPKDKISSGRLFLRLKIGLSNRRADIDNPVKPILDILQKKYGFNDNQIYLMEIEKEDVEKGKEYIEFDFSPLD
jgi:Holliday junction resolvase RusA-like endonuclease